MMKNMIECKHCGVLTPSLTIDAITLQRIADLLADGSKPRAIDEVRVATDCLTEDAQQWLEHFAACCKSWPFTSEDDLVLNQVDEAFKTINKPNHFVTDFKHCDECKEHDKTLLARTRETLRRQDIGNPGWDPLCFATGEAIGYLFPALSRFSLMPDGHGQYGWYGDQLIWHLSYESYDNRFLVWCNTEQRLAVCILLEHLSTSRQTLVADCLCENELASTIDLWRGKSR